MARYWLSLVMILGLPVLCLSQTTSNGATVTSAQCDAIAQTYETQRAQCSEYQQRISDMKNLIASMKQQRMDLLEECKHAPASTLKACLENADLATGRLGAVEQEYATVAQTGCQQQPIDLGRARACAQLNNPADKKTLEQVKQSVQPLHEKTLPAQVEKTQPAQVAKTLPAQVPKNQQRTSQPTPAQTGVQQQPRINSGAGANGNPGASGFVRQSPAAPVVSQPAMMQGSGAAQVNAQPVPR